MGEKSGDLRSRLEERLGHRMLRDRMELLRRETGGLLDGRALLAVLADEEGLAETSLAKLADLDPSRAVFTRGTVSNIGPVRDFQGRDRAGKLRKMELWDETGTVTLTLWDEETALVEQLGLKRGSAVRILSALLKMTRFGRELQVGKAGFIVPEGPPQPGAPSRQGDPGGLRDGADRVDVRGVILSSSTSGRGSQKVTALRLFDGTAECVLVLPHELLEPPPGLAPGVEMELSGALADRADGKTTLRGDAHTRIRTL